MKNYRSIKKGIDTGIAKDRKKAEVVLNFQQENLKEIEGKLYKGSSMIDLSHFRDLSPSKPPAELSYDVVLQSMKNR